MLSQALPKSAPVVQCGVRVPSPSKNSDVSEGSEGSQRKKNRKTASDGLELLDDGLIRDFAYKLHRMLCGASQILGLYVIATATDLAKYKASYETILKALLLDRTTTAISSTTFYLLTIPLSTGALSAQRCTFTEKNSSSTTENVQFRVTNNKVTYLSARTTWKVDLLLPVKRSIAGEHEQRFHKTLLKILSDECNKIESAIIVDNGSQQILEDDENEAPSALGDICLKLSSNVSKLSDLLIEIEEASNKASSSSRRKSRKSIVVEQEASCEEKQFSMFSRHMAPTEVNSFAVHQVASGAMRLRGSMVGATLIPSLEAEDGAKLARFLRLDLMRSLQSRVGYLFDNIAKRKESQDTTEDDADKTSLGRARTFQVELPRRVLIRDPSAPHTFFCDYLLPSETLQDCQERAQSALGLAVEAELEVVEEGPKEDPWTSAELATLPADSRAPLSPRRRGRSTSFLQSSIPYSNATSPALSKSTIALGLVALLAAIIALLVFKQSSNPTYARAVQNASSTP